MENLLLIRLKTERKMIVNRFSPSFFIGTISIGTVEGASCVNLGNNLPSGFVNYKKQNQGFGSISGDHTDIHDILATLEEKDIKDVFHYDPEEDQAVPQHIAQLAEAMVDSDLEIEE